MSRYQFDAYAALESLRDRYGAYLTDTFGIRSPRLASRLREHWSQRGDDHYPLLGPSLVQPAFPFPTRRSLSDLGKPNAAERTDDAPLHPKTVQMLRTALGFKLFEHQEEAIRQGSLGRTTVLSAGTGSGKTEAFLVSTIDALHWAEERGEDNLDQPGVRALVIYPLNALVNNQIARMQALLKAQTEPRMRFAFYTSRLPESHSAAKRWYTQRGYDLPPACQLIDRKTVRGAEAPDDPPAGPPHILVTNFSMLEYMLIRPLDRPFFLPSHLFFEGKPRFRIIVLDEAHVYAGAQATEIHMLLRRAALRFGTKLENVQGIATSATLAQGADEGTQRAALAEYGARMFAKPAGDVAVVLAKPVLPALPDEATNDARLAAPAERDLVPSDLRTLEFDEDGRPVAFITDATAASAVAQACVKLRVASASDVDRVPPNERDIPALVAWRLLVRHEAVHALRQLLHSSAANGPADFDVLTAQVFGSVGANERHAFDALLRLGAIARRHPEEHPLIPTRMHAWLRAPAGVWVEAPSDASSAEDWTSRQVLSAPPADDVQAKKFFELVICETCGRDYVLAFLTTDDWGRDAYSAIETPGAGAAVFAAAADGTATLLWNNLRGHRVDVAREERGRLKGKCEFCKDPRSVFRRLAVSPRAALGALVDGLYPYLAVHPASDRGGGYYPGRGRRLLTFSDSRQEAARVAHDVEHSHNVGLNRAVLYRAMRRAGDRPQKISDLIDDLARNASLMERAEVAEVQEDRRRNIDYREKLAELGLFQELARPAVDAPTLEGLGLVEVIYPDLPPAPAGVGMEQAEWAAFVSAVLDITRAQGAVARPSSEMPDDLRTRAPRFIDRPIVRTAPEQQDDDDEDAGVLRKRFVALISPKETARIRAYAEAVARRAGTPGGGVRLLDAVWNSLKELSDHSRWLRWSDEPQGYLIALPRLSIRAHERPVFIEPLSGRVFPRSVRGVAPVGAKPSQDLRPLSDEEYAQWRARNAVTRVLDDEILGLATTEHTAQIDVDTLDEAERAFRTGRTNLLACSTTMEMGVDLGGLTLVMMTNVPPAAANYWQRAGRAGRRADGSSLALSLALQQPHDQKVFREPQAFLAQPMVPPQVRFDIPALLSRHVFATLLAAFFEAAVVETSFGNPLRAFGTTGDFFATPVGPEFVRPNVLELAPDARCMADVFAGWLDHIADDGPVASKLDALCKGTILATRNTSELALACRNSVMRIADAVRRDLAIIEEQRAAQVALGEGAQDRTLLNALKYQDRQIRNELLIGQLAKGDVLPRFGFPLDVVRLETKWRIPDRDEEARGDREEDPALRMERDLKLALSDYVPGTKVLAAKELHRSAGLVRNWHADDEDRARIGFYVHCTACGFLEERRTTELTPCTLCGHPVDERLADAPESPDTEPGPTPIRRYLVPSSFAVKAGDRPERPDGMARPERMPPAFVFVSAAGRSANFVELGGGLSVGFEPSTRVAFRSEGRLAKSGRRGFGYAVCQRCGRAEPEEAMNKEKPPEAVQSPHEALRGSRRCTGNLWRHIALGTFGSVDTLRFRLAGPLAPNGPRRVDEEDFFMSLAVCLQDLVAERLKVDRRTLSAAIGTWKAPDGRVAREAIVWDPSTSGLLEHVLPNAADLICELVEKLERDPDLLSYVRFDNQFMVAQGRFRLDLLRAHFLDDVRRQHLPSRGARADLPAEPRSEPLRSRAMEAFDETTSGISLLAPTLANDAFSADGLLRMVHASQLRGRGGVRLLLHRVPQPEDSEQVVLAGRLRALIDSGAEVRVLPDPAPFSTFARVLYTARGIRRALGAVRRAEDGWKVTDECFGSSWGRGFVTVEASGTAGESLFAAFEGAWAKAQKLDPSALIPRQATGIHYVAVREGATEAESTSLASALTKCLGSPNTLGRVSKVLYVDRYVARSALALWNLFRTLEAFRYVPGAAVRVRCLVPRGAGNRELVDVFRDRAWEALSPKAHHWFHRAAVDRINCGSRSS